MFKGFLHFGRNDIVRTGILRFAQNDSYEQFTEFG